MVSFGKYPPVQVNLPKGGYDEHTASEVKQWFSKSRVSLTKPHTKGRMIKCGYVGPWGMGRETLILSNFLQVDWDLTLSMLVFTARQIHHAMPYALRP